MRARTCIAAIFGSLLGLAGSQSCTSSGVSTSEVGQEADGCGAYRYRGSANIDCRYTATLVWTTPTTGTCLNDSQVQCTYPAVCEWTVSQVITDCVSGAPDCLTSCPPEGSPPIPTTEYTFDLSPGSTLCDPPGTAAQLTNYCNSVYTPTLGGAMSTTCTSATDRDVCGATCCLNCAQPNPLPGAAAVGTGTDGSGSGSGSCSAEDN